MKKNYFRLVFYLFSVLMLLTLIFYPQLSKGQTFVTGFNSYVTNDLYLNGWDFSTAEWSIGQFAPFTTNHIASANLPTNFSFYSLFTGYSFVPAGTPIDVEFDAVLFWTGSNDRRARFDLILRDINNNAIRTRSFNPGSGVNGDIRSYTASFPGSDFSSDGWYYIEIRAQRRSSNGGGVSYIDFDNFDTDLPTNSDWPELSPNVTVSHTLSVSNTPINVGEQAVVTFEFEYNEVITSPSQRGVRGLEYEFELHSGLDYVSHTITGASAGTSSYNPITSVLTINAVQKNTPFTLDITVEGVEGCEDCGVVEVSLNANELQPMTGFNTTTEILSVLPIELIYFKAEPIPSRQSVQLNWATAMELENDFFTIERSRDGLNFYKVAEIPGAGTHSGILEYSFTDITALEGTSYYRLKQTDIGGRSFSYSEVVRVQLPFGKQDITPFPNPVRPNERLQFSLSGNWEETLPVELMVFSQTGTLMQRLESEIPLERVISLEIPPDWAPEIYLVKVRQGIYQTSKRIIVKP